MSDNHRGILAIRLEECLDRRARVQPGYSQIDLANAVSVSGAAISRYFAGQRKPSGAILAKIAKEFDTTVEYLQGQTDNPRRTDAPALPAVVYEIAPLVEGLSDDGIEDLRTAIRSVRFADERRQQDIRERDIYAQIAYDLLSEDESRVFTEALLLARSGNISGANALVDDIIVRLRGRLRQSS